MTDFHERSFAILDEVRAALAAVPPAEVEALQEAIRQARRVFIAGVGRSGLQMRAFAMRLMHLGLPVHVVGDVTTPGIGPGDLLLIGSGSARTASLVAHAARARELGAPVALITAAAASPIHEQASFCLRIPAPTPKLDGPAAGRSIQPMGSLFETVLGVLLDAAILGLMDDAGTSGDEMFSRHANLE